MPEGISVSCKRVGNKWKCKKYPKYYRAEGQKDIKGTFDKVFVNNAIHTSLDEDGSFSAGGFGDCRPRKGQFGAEGERLLDCKNFDVEDMGDKIEKAWKEYLRGIPARDIESDIKKQFENITEEEEEDYGGDFPNLYVVFTKDDKGNVDVLESTIDYPSYFQGASGENLVAVIPLSRHTTKKDLMGTDVAEETHYYDNPEWSGEV